MVALVVTVAIIRFTGNDGEDGRFAADFPSKPVHQTSTFAFGGTTTRTDIYMSEIGEDAVGVGVTNVSSLSDAQITEVLDTAARTSVAALGYRLTSRKPLTVDGDRALDIAATGAPQITYRSRFIHHEGRIYQVIGIATNGHASDAYAEFLRSFRFT